MKRIAWLTDIHLNFLSPVHLEKFFSVVRASNADSVLISGDIGEAPRLLWYLQQLEMRLQRPIYIVLGNHDYYGSSVADVRVAVADYVSRSRWLKWMNTTGVVELTPGVGLIGHDGWSDGRCGNYAASNIMMNDYLVIQELADISKEDRLYALQHLGDEAAAFCREWLPQALGKYPHVFFLTHVPPFCDACRYEGQPSGDDFLPHFADKALGDALLEVMAQYPNKHVTILCGHTHNHADIRPRDNLRVIVGGAEYSRVEIQQVFEFPEP